MERTKIGEFNWVDLSASDVDAQTAFYEGLFGWTHEDVPFGNGAVYKMLKLGGKTVGGATQMNPDMQAAGTPTMWNTYIRSDNVDVTAALAAVLSGEIVMPAMDVPGQGRMVGIADPTGGAFFLWKPITPDPTMAYMETGSLIWSELSTRDPQKAIYFYTKLLGWNAKPLDAGAAPYWQIEVDGVGEGGVMPMPDMVPAETPAFWMPYFAVDEVAASVAKATELGASVQAPPVEVPGMLVFSVLADPAGATFAIMTPMMPG